MHVDVRNHDRAEISCINRIDHPSCAGVPEDATEAQIKKGYRVQAMYVSNEELSCVANSPFFCANEMRGMHKRKLYRKGCPGHSADASSSMHLRIRSRE